jgi:hypothetical protein
MRVVLGHGKSFAVNIVTESDQWYKLNAYKWKQSVLCRMTEEQMSVILELIVSVTARNDFIRICV